VILEPRRRPRAATKTDTAKPAAAALTASRPTAQATEELDPESDLLFRAGALFIQRGRVAVSMLQRDFNLDFKQATSLLDQLQEAGLIGPYLGGQRRDILLTIEEWRERRLRTA
jgi:DNA segregation ATPase FtsK/SpoIIIE-like protein